MAYYVITAFAGTTIVTSWRDMVAMSETAPVMSRVGYLENGVKFDADASADADVALGQVEARYIVRSDTKGMTSFNTAVATLTGLRGKRGTLTGVERASGGDVSKTCTARCIDITEETYRVRTNPPMHSAFRQQTYITVTWEKLTQWA